MNYKLIISSSLFLFSIWSCAQSKYGIKRVDAFSQEHMPGNIPVDQQGHPIQNGPDTITTIFLETKDVAIKWTAAWKSGRPFSVTVTRIDETPFRVGTGKISNEEIVLNPAPQNKLWRLELQPNNTHSKPPVKTKPGEIILQGKSGKKTIFQRISSLVELTTIPSV